MVFQVSHTSHPPRLFSPHLHTSVNTHMYTGEPMCWWDSCTLLQRYENPKSVARTIGTAWAAAEPSAASPTLPILSPAPSPRPCPQCPLACSPSFPLLCPLPLPIPLLWWLPLLLSWWEGVEKCG